MTTRTTPTLPGITPSLLCGLLLTACSLTVPLHDGAAQPPATAPAQPAAEEQIQVAGTLTAHFLDVGQGDATLLAGPDFTILIDAGRHDRTDVVPHLRRAGVDSIDLLIGTHAHADHIGQFPEVLAAFPVTEVWLSGNEHTSQAFERAVDAILDSEAGYHEPRAGEVVNIGSARVEVLNPNSLTEDLHESGVVVRVVFGDVAFLFTGDAEAETELEIIQRGHELNAEILQLGHHGSRTSSHPSFLDAVDPEIAIYSAGEDNSYGHPHEEVVDRVTNLGIKLYGTPRHGTIRVVADGDAYRVHAGRIDPIRGPPDDEPSDGCSAGQINVNTASSAQLQEIVHIGPSRAAQLIQQRPFSSLDQLTRVKGIAAGRLRDIKAQGLACVGK